MHTFSRTSFLVLLLVGVGCEAPLTRRFAAAS
jgi:hypothetical protein